MVQTDNRTFRPGQNLPLPHPSFQRKKVKPVKWFAWLGAGILSVEAYTIISWVLSGNMTRTPNGPDKVPTFMAVAAHVQEVLFPAIALFLFYRFCYKPWRRERRITFDGLFIIVISFMYWQDPLVNYLSPFATYNSVFWVQFGSWAGNVPGWISPNGNKFVEPWLFAGFAYPAWVFGGAVVGGFVMRWARAKWPTMGTVGTLLVCFGFLAAFDIVCEVTWLYLGSYAYNGSIRSMSIMANTYHQAPIYEFILWPILWTAITAIRFFKDDKGFSVVEKGTDQLKVGQKGKTFVRFLALTGGVQGWMLFFYCFPFAWINAHNDPWPADFNNRSYLRNELCGAGTTYHCPGPGIPINRPDSVHVGPDGQLVEFGEDGPRP